MSSVDRTRDPVALAPLQPVRRVRRTGEKQSECDADARSPGKRTGKMPGRRGPDRPGCLVDELV